MYPLKVCLKIPFSFGSWATLRHIPSNTEGYKSQAARNCDFPKQFPCRVAQDPCSNVVYHPTRPIPTIPETHTSMGTAIPQAWACPSTNRPKALGNASQRVTCKHPLLNYGPFSIKDVAAVSIKRPRDTPTTLAIRMTGPIGGLHRKDDGAHPHRSIHSNAPLAPQKGRDRRPSPYKQKVGGTPMGRKKKKGKEAEPLSMDGSGTGPMVASFSKEAEPLSMDRSGTGPMVASFSNFL